MTAALAGVAVVAGIDALRQTESAERSSPPGTRPDRTEPPVPITEPLGGAARFVAIGDRHPPSELSERSFAAGLLDSAGLSGRLYLSDEDCRLRGYHLPTLDVQRLPDVRSCSFAVSDDGWLALEDAVWQLRGSLATLCRSGRIEVVTRGGDAYERFPGCAPTWGPDGALGYLLDGDLRRWPGGDLVVSGGGLTRALGARAARQGAAIQEAVWPPSGVAADAHVAGAPEKAAVLAVYDPARRTATVLARAGAISDLAASRDGRYLAVRADGVLRVLAVAGDAGPGRVTLVLPEAGAFAWSPDGRWIAVAIGGRLTFVPADGGKRRPSLGPIVAQGLAWRPGQNVADLPRRRPAERRSPARYASACSVTHSRSSPE